MLRPLKGKVGYKLAESKWSKTLAQAPLAFNCQIDLMFCCFFKVDRFLHPSMADNVIACRCSSVIYPHLPLSPSHFQNALSTFSIERVNEIPLWDFCTSDFQSVENNNYSRIMYRNDNIARPVKTVMMRKNAHSRSYVKISSIIPSVFVTHIPAFANSCCNI